MPRKSKNPILRAEWPKISDLRPSGMNTFMVDARPHGKREYFDTVGEARTRADQALHKTLSLNLPFATALKQSLKHFGVLTRPRRFRKPECTSGETEGDV